MQHVIPSSTVPASIYKYPFTLTTFGIIALIVFNAFESMAVTTVMPVAAEELGMPELYALSFAGPLAVSVIGMVLAGSYADRKGPVGAIYGSVALFVVGLIVAGTATSMPMLVVGRIIQGFAGGANGVALTVLVAKVYPAELHAKMFAAFAAAWVIPSMVGPYVGGIVAEKTSWHWVFLGVLVLVIPAMLGLVPALRRLSASGKNSPDKAPGPYPFGKMTWSIVAAAAVLALSLGGEVKTVGWSLALAALALCLFAIRPLIPRGTLRARRGLPSVILARGIGSAAFFGAEVFMPKYLYDVHHFSAAAAGFALTCSAVSWAVTSSIQSRLGEARLSHDQALKIGSATLFAVVAGILAVVALNGPAWLLIVVWLFGGAGMGLMFPRMSVMTLAMSRPGEQGFNSSALAMGDSLGNAICVAVSGVILTFTVTTANPYVGVFVAPVVCAAVMLFVSRRTTVR